MPNSKSNTVRTTTMGWLSKCYDWSKKLFEKAILMYGSYVYGDNKNDEEKITQALIRVQNNINNKNTQEKPNTTEYCLFVLIVIVIVILFVIAVRMLIKFFVERDRRLRRSKMTPTPTVRFAQDNE